MKKVKPEKIAPHTETVAVADRLHSAAIHLLRRVRKQDAVSGVGPAQLSALSVLVFGGPKTLGDLAAQEPSGNGVEAATAEAAQSTRLAANGFWTIAARCYISPVAMFASSNRCSV